MALSSTLFGATMLGGLMKLLVQYGEVLDESSAS